MIARAQEGSTIYTWMGRVVEVISCLLVVSCVGFCIYDIPREQREHAAKWKYIREQCEVMSYVGSTSAPVPVYRCPGGVTTWQDLRLPP